MEVASASVFELQHLLPALSHVTTFLIDIFRESVVMTVGCCKDNLLVEQLFTG